MSQKHLSNWLKLIIIGVGICGLILYLLVLPMMGRTLTDSYPEFSGWFWPWLLFLWSTALPCYLVLRDGWEITVSIGADRSFSYRNAMLLKRISRLALSDTVLLFAGNLLYFFLGMNHPGVMLAFLFICFAGICITVAAAALSHLVYKAAALQEETEYTI